MDDDYKALREKLDTIEQGIAALQHGRPRGIRKRSAHYLWGLPLYDIAVGPDPERGEVRGHARGVLAIGDIATGILALGGLARGVVAVGGVALGIFCFGGCSLGILLVTRGPSHRRDRFRWCRGGHCRRRGAGPGRYCRRRWSDRLLRLWRRSGWTVRAICDRTKS